MIKHSPGPWLRVADGIVSQKTGQVVCVFTHAYPGDSSECAANEVLIAAAPELLQELEDSTAELVELLPVFGHLISFQKRIARKRTLIAKARGLKP